MLRISGTKSTCSGTRRSSLGICLVRSRRASALARRNQIGKALDSKMVALRAEARDDTGSYADFLVLTGDETALPGIARILGQLDDNVQGLALIEIDGLTERQSLVRPVGMELQWLDRQGAKPGTTELLMDAVRSVVWPSELEKSFFWGGCEHKAFRAIHRILRQEIGLPRTRQVFYSHWHRNLNEEEIIAIRGKAYLPD